MNGYKIVLLKAILCFIGCRKVNGYAPEYVGFVATVDYSKLACSSDLKLRTPKVTATLADKSITFTQESQEASSWANRDDQVYAVVYEKALNEVEMVKLRERGENGVTSFALPEDWTAAEVLVYAFATTVAGRRTSRTLAISME